MKRFLDEIDRRPVPIPGMFCVFYYRSANPKTLEILSTFMPVPVQGLIDEFATGATPVDVCARTIRALRVARRAAHLHLQSADARCLRGHSRRSRARAVSRSLQVPSAIDTDRFAGDEVAVDEREHDLRDLGFSAPAAERRRALDGRELLV